MERQGKNNSCQLWTIAHKFQQTYCHLLFQVQGNIIDGQKRNKKKRKNHFTSAKVTINMQTTVKEVRIHNDKSSFVIYQRADLRCNDDYDGGGVGNNDEDDAEKGSW